MTGSDRFEVEILPKAEKDLDDLKHHREQAVAAILQLETNPLLGHTLTGSLRGTRSLEFNLKGSGAYRAVYTVIDEDRVCIIFIVGPHENIYKKAERRWAAVKRRL